jgi:hypothetical protein
MYVIGTLSRLLVPRRGMQASGMSAATATAVVILILIHNIPTPVASGGSGRCSSSRITRLALVSGLESGVAVAVGCGDEVKVNFHA